METGGRKRGRAEAPSPACLPFPPFVSPKRFLPPGDAPVSSPRNRGIVDKKCAECALIFEGRGGIWSGNFLVEVRLTAVALASLFSEGRRERELHPMGVWGASGRAATDPLSGQNRHL